MAAKPADRIGYIKCLGCGFDDAHVNVSVKTNCAYHSCPKCKDFSRGTENRDKALRATMHTKPKGDALPPKRERGRPRSKPKSKTKAPKERAVVEDDDNEDDDEQGDFWKFW